MKEFLILTLTFTLLNLCSCAKILGIIATPCFSHQLAFRPLWRQLSLRGHQVTILTTDPINDPSLKNLTEIDLHDSYEHWNRILPDIMNSNMGGLDNYIMEMPHITRSQLRKPEVKKVIEHAQSFDVVLIENLVPTYFGFGEKCKCPIIGISTLESPSVAYQSFGSPTHPIAYPDLTAPTSGKQNFYERLFNVIFTLRTSYLRSSLNSKYENIAREEFGLQDLDLQKAFNSMEMMFVTSSPIFNPVRPLTPNVILIGGDNRLKPVKPLPEEMQKFLDDAKDGFIYFSLGSTAKSKYLSENVLNVIMETFSKLPYKVLWKFEKDELVGKPSNVMIYKWLPQEDVLRHPNIKLFIYQCGLQSTEEALFSKVPVLAIPMLGDQGANAKSIVEKGMGLSLSRDELNTENFRSTILELIKNPKYRQRVAELAAVIEDQPMTGLEKAVWWTEYVIRHKGAKQLRSQALEIPLYQYYLLDIIGFFLLVVLLLLAFLYILVKFCIRCIRYLLQQFSTKKVKKL